MKTDFKDIWQNQEIEAGSRTTKQGIDVELDLRCFIGRIGASNAKMFQIEIGSDVAIHKNYLKRFHGVEIRVIESNEDKKCITLILSDNDLQDVFILFLEDLLNGLGQINKEEEVPQLINDKVSYWERLFARIKGVLISKERQRGLYGELTFLKSILSGSKNQIKSVLSWTGPEGSNQDFSNELNAVEVKTSRATKPAVNIANELQLDWTVLDRLYLLVIHVDEMSNGKASLTKLILEIKNDFKSQHELLKLFEDKLDRLGIAVGEELYYDEIGYIIRSEKAYQVKDGFPILINSNINNAAIHNVKYTVDLTAFEAFVVSKETVINDIQ